MKTFFDTFDFIPPLHQFLLWFSYFDLDLQVFPYYNYAF
jgi:hypothetical protein